MTEEIKEILDRFNKGHDELTVEEYILLENYITNLQQENEKLKLDVRYWENKWQNTRFANNQVKVLQDTIIKSANNTNRAMEQTEIYKSRCEGTVNLIDKSIEIIKQQPTKDDSWILSRLYGFKYALNGSDE